MEPKLEELIFDVAVLAVAKVLNRYDPIGLIRIHCPADEYVHEAEEILQRMKGREFVEDVVLDVVFGVFDESFNYSYSMRLVDTPNGIEVVEGSRKRRNPPTTDDRESFRPIARELLGIWRS